MKTPYYFGFGSLVNEQTLPAGTQWHRATLKGWRRSWRHPIPGERHWAAMDVLPDANSSIDGLLVVGGSDIDSYLLERESGYSPLQLEHGHFEIEQPLANHAAPCLWTSKSPRHTSDDFWLMQSYVDVVMTGYLRHFGEEGLARFVETTDNWQLPAFDDRDDPRYPRSVQLSTRERGIIASFQPNT